MLTRNAYFFLISALCLWLINPALPSYAYAATASNEDYSIEFGDLDSSLPQPTSRPKIIPNQIKSVINQLPNIPSGPPPYTISSTNDYFGFNLSSTVIDFGALTATNPVTRTSNIAFSTPTYGAQIMAYQNHPFLNTERAYLPDTTCDNGTCTQTISSLWENSLTYGFGFRCDSEAEEVCGKEFTNPNNFKQFADVSANESPASIILNQQSKQNTSAKFTYKINISGTQPAGGYSNIVTFVAVPNF